MENEVPTMLNWLVSKNGREWFYIGTTTHAVTVLIVKKDIQQRCPYLKIEEVIPNGESFLVTKVIRNTFEEARTKQEKEDVQEEVNMLDKLYYEGNDQTH